MSAVKERSLPALSQKRTFGRVGSYALRDEIVRARKAGVEVLDLSGASPYGPPRHVLDAAARAVEAHAPVPSRGLAPLRQAVAAKLANENGLSVNAEDGLLITVGAMQALTLAMLAVLEPGDEVLIPSPCFFFDGIVRLAGGIPKYVAMPEDEGFAFDIDAVASEVGPRTKALIVSSPVNPTGYVFTEPDILALRDLVANGSMWLISDESYEKLVYEGRHISPATLPGLGDRTITIQSFTKSYSLGPWRVGAVAARPDAIDLMRNLLEWHILRCPHISQHAALAALAGPQDWVAAIRDDFKVNRDVVAGAIAAAHASLVVPAGGPSFFIKAPSGVSGSEFSTRLLWNFGVPSVPGECFGHEGRVRVQFGGTPATIRTLASRLASALSGGLK